MKHRGMKSEPNSQMEGACSNEVARPVYLPVSHLVTGNKDENLLISLSSILHFHNWGQLLF